MIDTIIKHQSYYVTIVIIKSMAQILDQLESYARAVEYNADNKINTVFYNKDDKHAIIVFNAIFRHAKHSVYIAAGNLNNNVTRDEKYLDGIKKFLSLDNVKLHILVSEIKKEGNILFEVLKNYPDKVCIKCSDGRMFTNKNNDIIHFCVADECMYRIENDTKERCASCNFYDIDISKKLSNSFMQAYNQCTNVFSFE